MPKKTTTPTPKTTPTRKKRVAPETRKEHVRHDIEEVNALNALKHSEGGLILADRAIKSVISTMDSIAAGYALLSHSELQGLGARLAERLGLFRVIVNAGVESKVLEQELKEALTEDPD